MKYILVFLLILTIIICSAPSCEKRVITNPEFNKIVLNYVNYFNEIPNNCNLKPFYEIFFYLDSTNIAFRISAHLEKTYLIPSEPEENPIEIKGVFQFNNHPIVIFDFKDSNGHELYNPLLLDNSESYSIAPDTCVYVLYPESWHYLVSKDSIYLIEKEAPYHLK